MGVVSAAISSLNVLDHKIKSKNRNNNNNDDNNDDGNNSNDDDGDDNESDSSSITSIDHLENQYLQSPPKSAKRNSLKSPNFIPGSPFSQFNKYDQQSQSMSPSRRSSVQQYGTPGGNGSINNRRGSMASAVYKPPQILANYKNLCELRKRIGNKYGLDVIISAFSVTLGGFDRKIFIRPILLPIIQNNTKKNSENKKIKVL